MVLCKALLLYYLSWRFMVEKQPLFKSKPVFPYVSAWTNHARGGFSVVTTAQREFE